MKFTKAACDQIVKTVNERVTFNDVVDVTREIEQRRANTWHIRYEPIRGGARVWMRPTNREGSVLFTVTNELLQEMSAASFIYYLSQKAERRLNGDINGEHDFLQ